MKPREELAPCRARSNRSAPPCTWQDPHSRCTCRRFDNLWIHRAVYAAREGDILVISTSGGLEAGYWGDILNEAAIAQHLGGIVIDGGVRDSAGLIRNTLRCFRTA